MGAAGPTRCRGPEHRGAAMVCVTEKDSVSWQCWCMGVAGPTNCRGLALPAKREGHIRRIACTVC
eukprot:1158444-Pelagomonas_calceolata.AAC.5